MTRFRWIAPALLFLAAGTVAAQDEGPTTGLPKGNRISRPLPGAANPATAVSTSADTGRAVGRKLSRPIPGTGAAAQPQDPVGGAGARPAQSAPGARDAAADQPLRPARASSPAKS